MADNGFEAFRLARMHSGHAASVHPHINQGLLQRGRQGGVRGDGGGGVRAGFGGGTPERTGGTSRATNNDPAISGEGYEKNPTVRFYGFPVAGGDLTEGGKAQQHDHQLYQQFAGAYAQLRANGASNQEAFQQAARSLPGGVATAGQLLMSHPEALSILQNTGSLFDHLDQTAQSQKTQIKGADGKVYNVDVNPDGSISNPQDVGLPGTPPKPGKPTVLKTDQGDFSMDEKGNVTPLRDPDTGKTLMDASVSNAQAKAAAKSAGLAPSDVPGVGPQVTNDVPPKGSGMDRLTTNMLTAAPTVINALTRMQRMADNVGLVKGPLAVAAGEYFGINGGGAQFKADRDLIQANAPLIMGSGYAAATKNFMEGTATPSNAPSFVKLQAGQMINAIRDRAQGTADAATTGHQVRLPATLASQLIGVGVVPNGYQNSQTFQQMDAAGDPNNTSAIWKMRYQPAALNSEDRTSLALGAAHGQITDPSVLQGVTGLRQQFARQRAAMQQQQGSSQAALAAQQSSVLGAGQPNPAVGQVPPAAQQQNGNQQGAQQPPGQTQGQPSQGQQGNVQEQQGVQQSDTSAPQGNVAPPAGQGLIPGGALPNVPAGQPQPGMPGTNGQTPLPPANPLPNVSQNVTQTGQTPMGAPQPSLQPASPQANTQAATPQNQAGQNIPLPSAIAPNAGASNAVPGAQGEADSLAIAAGAQAGM